ncbi:MAG: hypothetical protein ACYDCO_20760 [Armatimonadota bacterium]
MRIEARFNADMIQIYQRAKKECKYNATRFLQMLSERGGLETAHTLIATEGGTDGFIKLWECGRLDLSVEALVLKEEYHALFTEDEREMCRKRLERYDYKVK